MVFVFGQYELDSGRFEVTRAGEVCPIEPQVFDVLRYLIEHRDRVVTKNELLDNIWGDRFVSESALTSRIKTARKLVGDDGKSQRVIKTVHGRGYRFMEAVTERDGRAPATAATAVEPPTVAQPVTAPPALGVGREDRIWPLLGRGAELERVATLFGDPDRGGVLLVGNAGIGKTRLAEEILAVAAASGIPTARAAAHPEAKAIPLAALAHLLPLDDIGTSGDTDLDRATLFRRARAAFAGDTRQVLHVDDVDHLDELSRALLASLVADRAVFAVLTMRSRPDPVPTVEHLAKDGHIEEIALEPLDTETIEVLLHRALGGPVVADTTKQLADASLGNPGIVRQVVESSVAAGTLRAVHGVWELAGPLRVPPSLASLVTERLDDLHGEQVDAVELLAVAGGLGVELLASLTSEATLEELERRGVIRLRTDGRRHDAALSHPLYGEIVRSEMPTLRARRLKRRLADAIDELGARRREDRIRVVAWRLDTGGTATPELVLRTAQLAFFANDLDTADALLDRLAADESPSVVQLRAEVAFRRGEADEVERLLSSIDLEPLDDAHRGQIIRRRATNFFFDTSDYHDAVELIDTELRRVRDPDVRKSLDAHLVMLLANGGQVGLALDRATAALPDSTGAARLELIRASALAHVHAARPLAALELAREGQALHHELDDDPARPGMTLLLFVEVVALTAAPRVNEARAAAQRAKEEHPAGQSGWIDTAVGRVELLAGRPVAARRALTPVINHARAHQHVGIERWALALHATAHVMEGHADLAVPELDRVTELEIGARALYHPEIDRAHAWLAAAEGDLDAAIDKLVESVADCEQRGHLGMVAQLLHDVARFGAPDRVYERLEEIAAVSDGDLFVARGLLARGLVDDDPDRIERAAGLFEGGGCRLYAAEAAAALADALRRAGRSDDAEAAALRSADLRRSGGVILVSPALP